MKILITGGSGFIGQHLMELFPDAFGYDLKDSNDILDTENLLAYMDGSDIVIHLAALVSVEESKREPLKYLSNNIIGTTSVLECAIKSGVKRIIYASSAACYDPSSSPYALSKYSSELLMQVYRDMIHTTSLRFFNIYGTGQNPHYGAVITAFHKGIENKEITIYGNGKQTRDFTAVEDVCRSIKLATEVDIPSGEVIDIGTGRETPVFKLATIMSDILKKEPKVNFAPARKEIKYSVADTNKAKILLGFEANISLEEGLINLLK